MIRITKQTDYGIVLLTHMVSGDRERYNAPELAEEAGLPAAMVSKILKLLARDGVLNSHRGVKGGYALARDPEEISVDEVITALEGPVAITECVDDTSECAHEALCPTRGNWQRINQAVREALCGISLAEMALPLNRRQKLVNLGDARGLSAAGGIFQPVQAQAEPG
jgi:FeS assembly SUF system regulator